MNPFLMAYTTPYGVPPFDQIRFEHFEPAFDVGFEEQSRQYQAIEDNPEPPSFENTIEALERSGATLSRVARVFYSLLGTDSTDELSELSKDIGAKMAAQRNRLYLSQSMYKKVAFLYENPSDDWSAEQHRLVSEMHRKFCRAGVQLAESKRTRLEEIDSELSRLSSQYRDNLLSETNNATVHVVDDKQLEGIPSALVASASALAAAKGVSGWLFKPNRVTLYPVLTYARNRAVREQLYKAYLNRARRGNEYDSTDIAQQMATLRVEKANLLGAPNYAAYVLQDSMAKDPETVLHFLDQIWAAASSTAQRDARILEETMKHDGVEGIFEPWDWWYYTELVRQEQYDFSDDEVRPYFSANNVLQGAMDVASQLFGIAFRENPDLPVYHQDVRVFEVLSAETSDVMGVIYIDYYARDSKRGGAWMSSFQVQHRLDKDTLPIVINVCNFPPPTETTPSLLSSGNVKTLFHELGHALHGLLSSVDYPSLSGTNVVRDYVEFPSQLMENWGRAPEVMQQFARHYQSNEPIPGELLNKMAEATNFNQGFLTTEYLAASYLDLAWHMQEGPSKTADQIEQEVADRIGLPPEIGFRYRSTYFAHIFAGGYSSYYYCYIWAAVLEKDAFALFEDRGLFHRETASKLLQHVYSKGNASDSMSEYRAFRGSEPQVDALIAKRGLS